MSEVEAMGWDTTYLDAIIIPVLAGALIGLLAARWLIDRTRGS